VNFEQRFGRLHVLHVVCDRIQRHVTRPFSTKAPTDPRYKASKQLETFQEMLDNIFDPMFEATVDPEKDPLLSRFLENISGFDTVDDESKLQSPVDRHFTSKKYTPEHWNLTDNPS